MELNFPAFAFIMTLAAVINGMGIVRLLASFGEYLKRQGDLEIVHYWVFNLWITFQFLLHVLMWWSLWNARVAEAFNFQHYIYLLSGPILAYLGSSLLLPELENSNIDMRKHFHKVRAPYFTILSILWVWVIFLYPILAGRFAPTAPFLVFFLAITLTLRFTTNPKIHAAAIILVWLLLAFFVATFAMQFGAIAEAMKLGG